MSAAAGRAVRWAASIVIVLNMLDAVWTLTFVRIGAANEGNPLMDQALEHGPLWFMLAKLTLVSLSVMLLWRLRHRRSATVGLFSAALTYLVICGYHVSQAHHLLLAVR
jgi:cytochrome bd-type quinol oxidase subunit 2